MKVKIPNITKDEIKKAAKSLKWDVEPWFKPKYIYDNGLKRIMEPDGHRLMVKICPLVYEKIRFDGCSDGVIFDIIGDIDFGRIDELDKEIKQSKIREKWQTRSLI